MVKYSEVFKVAGTHSVRGFVSEIDEETITVDFTDHGDYHYTEKFSMEDVGEKLFENERDLVRVKGDKILELAPPRIIELKYAKDFYGQPISEGNFVIAMADEPLYHKIEGYVKRTYMLSSLGFERMTFVDLVDENDKPVYTRVLASYFTTPERFASPVVETAENAYVY